MPNEIQQQQAAQQERNTYFTLIGIFASLFAVFSTLKRQRAATNDLKPFDLALLGLATYRGGRLIAFDKVAAPLRAPFDETKPDEFGAGDIVAAKGSGVQKAIGELLGCPTCTGTWVSAGLVYGLGVAPGPTRVAMTILGTAGVAEILNTTVEALNWSSHAARKQAGTKTNSGDKS